MSNIQIISGIAAIIYDEKWEEILTIIENKSKLEILKVKGMVSCPLETCIDDESLDDTLGRLAIEELFIRSEEIQELRFIPTNIKFPCLHQNTIEILAGIYIGTLDKNKLFIPTGNEVGFNKWIRPNDLLVNKDIHKRRELDPILQFLM